MFDGSLDILALVQNFRAHIREYKSPTTKEAAIRQQFIDPFWRALGWDVGDTRGAGPSEAEVIIAKNVETVDETAQQSALRRVRFSASLAAARCVQIHWTRRRLRGHNLGRKYVLS